MKREFERTIEALDEIFRSVDEFTAEEAIDDDGAFAVKLAIEELFTNMVRHNTGGRDHIAIRLEREGDRLVLNLTDFDVESFDASDIGAVDVRRPLSEREVGGLGVHLVRKLFDELSYQYIDGTLCVTAVKHIGRKDVQDTTG